MRYGSAWGSSGKYSPVFVSFRDYTKDVVSNGKLFTIKFKVKSSIPNEGVRVEVIPHDNSNFTYKNLNKNWDGFVTSNNRFYENLKYKTLGITLNRYSESVSIDKNYESDMTVKASSVEYFKSFGEDCISVSFNIMNNVGISSLMLRVEFDETYLEVLDVFNGNVFSRGCLDWGNMSWYFDSNVENRLLVFEGKGFMPDCLESDTHPWSVWGFEGDCGLVLKGSIEVVGEYCFCNDSNIKDIYIGKSVKTIKRGAFKNTGIKDIIIPENVYEVREEALIVKNGLDGLWRLKESTRLESGSYVLKNGAGLRGCKVKMSLGSDCDIYGDGESLYIFGAGSTVNHYETLEYNEWNSVISGYETIVVGAEIDTLGSLLFDGMSSLKCVKAIGTELKVIESKTFNNCKNLESLTNFDFVEYIGSKAFDNTKIVNKDSEVIIGRCLYYCGNGFNKSSYYVDENVVQICYNAFKDKECLVLIDFKNVRRIENFAFERCRGLKKIVISDGVYHVGAESFKDCTSAMDIVIGYNACAETYALGYEYIQNFRKLNGLRIFVMRGSGVIEYLDKWNFEYTVIDKYVFNIKFIADGVVVYETDFGVLDMELDYIPEVPEKDMYYCQWEEFTLRPEDMVVHAVYTAMNPADFLIYEDVGTYSKVIGMSRDCVGVLNIPEYHNGLPVREVGYEAFSRKSMEEINLPKSVRVVEEGAFYYSKKLKRVSGFNWVESLGDRALYGTGIEEFVVKGDRLKSVGYSCFGYCTDLLYVYLGNGLYDLSNHLFTNCIKLQNFTIPERVTRLPYYSFSYCRSLGSIDLQNINYIENYCFSGCDSLKYLGDCSNVETLENYCFMDCYSLEEVAFPKVSNIPDYCFRNCKGLKRASFSKNDITAKYYAFSNCSSLEEVEGNFVYIGQYCFEHCEKLYNIFMENAVTIGSQAFWDCFSLTGEIYLPKIEELYGFSNSNIESLIVGGEEFSKDIKIGNLRKCASLKSVSIKTTGGVTLNSTVSKNVYTGCFDGNSSINVISIESGKKIVFGRESMNECVGLLKLHLKVGESSTLTNNCCSGCVSLNSLILEGSFALGADAFYGCNSLETADLSGVSSLGTSCFYRCESLKTVIFGTEVDIGEDAFCYCYELESVVNNNCIRNIGGSAFYYCKKLTDINFTGVVSIGRYAFVYCKALKSVVASSSLTTLGSNAFEGCDSLESVNLYNSSLVRLGDNYYAYGEVFENCISLSNVTLPNTLEHIDGRTFLNCVSLKNITIPNSVTYIGQYCFDGAGIESFIIGANITTFEDGAIDNCPNLKELEVKSKYFLGSKASSDYVEYIKNPYFNTLKLSGTASSYYIQRMLFSGCTNLTTVTGLNKIYKIDHNGFKDCPVVLDGWVPKNNITLTSGCLNAATHSGVLKFNVARISLDSIYNLKDSKVPVFGEGVKRVYFSLFTTVYNNFQKPLFHENTRVVAPAEAFGGFYGLKTENTLVYCGEISRTDSNSVENILAWHLNLTENMAYDWLNLDSNVSNCISCDIDSSFFMIDGGSDVYCEETSVGVWDKNNVSSNVCLSDYFIGKIKNSSTSGYRDSYWASLLILKNLSGRVSITNNIFSDVGGIKIIYDSDFDVSGTLYNGTGVNKQYLGVYFEEGDMSTIPEDVIFSLGKSCMQNDYCYQLVELVSRTVFFGECCLATKNVYDSYYTPINESGVLYFHNSLEGIERESLKGLCGVKTASFVSGGSEEFTYIEDGLVYKKPLNNNVKKLVYVPDSWGADGCSVIVGKYDNPCDFEYGVFSDNKNIRYITIASDEVEVSVNKLNGSFGNSKLKCKIVAFKNSIQNVSSFSNESYLKLLVNGEHLKISDTSTPLWSLYICENKSDSYLKIESVGDNNSTPDYEDEYSNLALELNGVKLDGPNLTSLIDKVKIYINNKKKEWTFGSYFWYDMRVVNSQVSGREVCFDDICEFYVKNSSNNFDLVKARGMKLTLKSYSMAGLALRRDGSCIKGIELGNCVIGTYTEPFRTIIDTSKALSDGFSYQYDAVPWSVDINNLNIETYGSFYVSFLSGVSPESVIYAYGSVQNGYSVHRTISTYSGSDENVLANAHTLVCWKDGDVLVVGVPSVFEESSTGRKTSNILKFRNNKIKPNDLLVISDTGSRVSLADRSSAYPEWSGGITRKSGGGYGNIIIDSKIQSIGNYCFYDLQYAGILFKEEEAVNGSILGCNTIKSNAFSTNYSSSVLSGTLRLPRSLSYLDIHAFYNMPESGLLIWVYNGAVTYRSGVDVTWWTTEAQNFKNSGFGTMAFNTYNTSNTVNGIRVKSDNTNKGLYWYLKYRFVHDQFFADNWDGDNYWKVISINGFVKGSDNPWDSESEWLSYIDKNTGNHRILATDIEWAEMEAAEKTRWSDYL